jgi:hypothetical protein
VRRYVGSGLSYVRSGSCHTLALRIQQILEAIRICLAGYTTAFEGFSEASIVVTMIVPVDTWSSHTWESIKLVDVSMAQETGVVLLICVSKGLVPKPDFRSDEPYLTSMLSRSHTDLE